MKGINMKSLNYTQDILAIEDPAKLLLMLMDDELRKRKISYLNEMAHCHS